MPIISFLSKWPFKLRISLWILLYFCFVQLAAGNKKIAVLIGIGQYRGDTGWTELSSRNDISLMHNTLMNQGFANEDVYILQDQKATQASILLLLNTTLYQAVGSGDVVYFHFSGHGQQCMDYDGDELDGLDECIVPYDSPKNYQEGKYEGQQLITDDALNGIFSRIRRKLGVKGQLIVSIDACHSGTGIRANKVARGSSTIMASASYLNKIRNHIMSDLVMQNFMTNDDKDSSPLTAIFGSAPNQLNYEMKTETGESYGSLTYALSKCLTSMTIPVSYRELFSRVSVVMSGIAPLQQPQSEGTLDCLVFNGDSKKDASQYSILDIKNKVIKIDCGYFGGLHVGSKIALISTSKDTVWSGQITKSTTHHAFAQIDTDISPEDIKNLKCVILYYSFGSLVVDVYLDHKIPNMKELQKHLEAKNNIRLVQNDADISICSVEAKPQEIIVKTGDDFMLDSFSLLEIKDLDVFEKRLTMTIRKYLQAKLIRNLEVTDEDIKLDFELIPMSEDLRKVMKDSMFVMSAEPDGQIFLPIGSRFQVLITNQGIKPAYYSFLDIQPDQVINVLLPSGNYTAEDLRILPGQQIQIPIIFETGFPLGSELFKLIASDKPIDFVTPLYNRRIGTVSNIEKMYHKLLSDVNSQNKGQTTNNLKNLHVTSRTYIITQKSRL